MDAPKTLFYFQELRNSSTLLKGRLIAFDNRKNKKDDEYIATSGCVSNQGWKSQSVKGKGPIPRCLEVGIEHYEVKTTPYDRQNTTGIEGNFYHILPESVDIKGIIRGEFGIHFDANVPGSAGCIVVINKPAWDAFEVMMGHYRKAGLETIPLFVFYS